MVRVSKVMWNVNLSQAIKSNNNKNLIKCFEKIENGNYSCDDLSNDVNEIMRFIGYMNCMAGRMVELWWRFYWRVIQLWKRVLLLVYFFCNFHFSATVYYHYSMYHCIGRLSPLSHFYVVLPCTIAVVFSVFIYFVFLVIQTKW